VLALWELICVIRNPLCVLFKDVYLFYFCNTKPARSIVNYFVSKRYHDCIIFYIIV